MKKIISYRLRKCSDINMDLPFFEVIDEEGNIVMDISEDDDGTKNILFYRGCEGKNISIDLINEIIKEASELINNEKDG